MIINFHRVSKPFARRIHRNGQVWTYRIKGNADVQIRAPKGNVTLETDAYAMNGTTFEAWQKDRDEFLSGSSLDYSYAPAVPPSLVREWIDRYASDMLSMSRQGKTARRSRQLVRAGSR